MLLNMSLSGKLFVPRSDSGPLGFMRGPPGIHRDRTPVNAPPFEMRFSAFALSRARTVGWLLLGLLLHFGPNARMYLTSDCICSGVSLPL